MNLGIKAITYNEMMACCNAVQAERATGTGDNKDMVVAVMATFYRERFGPAVGSTAVNAKTGQAAIRYFDAEFKSYRWLVNESPERIDLHAERMDSLPAEGKGWVVHERPWQEVVYK